MKLEKMFDKRGILTDEAIKEFKRLGNGVSCECPEHLVGLLIAAKEFTSYQKVCLKEKGEDDLTHQWLKSMSLNFEHLISSTIVNLARMEGLIDEDNNFIK